jgi:hypothetical protein
MARMSRALASVVLTALLLPATVLAHGGGEPFIHVAEQRVIQGDTFTVVGADLGPDARVALEISASGQAFPVGQVIAQPDGHFTEAFVMPSATPDGYAELWARSDDGSTAMMWLLVGDGPDVGEPAQPSGTSGSAGWPLPLVGLAILWVVGLAAIAFVFMRSRTPVARRRRRRQRSSDLE